MQMRLNMQMRTAERGCSSRLVFGCDVKNPSLLKLARWSDANSQQRVLLQLGSLMGR
jgi:hypothetical protein